MNASYSKIIPNWEYCLSEEQDKYHFLTERHLQVMWFEQKYFSQPATLQGQSIEVYSPGIWNAEAGPDFLKAHIKIGDQEFRGDIEIHLSEESWFHHQHHLDDRYNQVILHVFLWRPKEARPAVTKNGKILASLHLENLITVSEARITQLIDLDLYPYKEFLGSGHCSQALFKGMPEEKMLVLFRSAAFWRLSQKERFLKEKITDPVLFLPAGMAMALGYKHNTEAFLSLFQLAYSLRDWPEIDLFAYCLGICGLFEAVHEKKWGSSVYYRTLKERYNQLSPSCKKQSIVLRHTQVRPFNHPVRRLAYLTKMIRDPTLTQIFSQMEAHWQIAWRNHKNRKNWKETFIHFLEMLPSYQDSYWNSHFSFETSPQKERLSMIGNDLKKAILINAFFPLLYGVISQRNNEDEIALFQDFNTTLSAEKTGKAKYLSHRFFGDMPKGAIMKRGDVEQGAYQIHHDFCLHYEASCLGCPFVENYHAVFGNSSSSQ